MIRSPDDYFFERLTAAERQLLAGFTDPQRIQAYIDGVPYSSDPVYRSPLQVLREQRAHCFDGALFAAMALRRIGHPPLILEMLPNERDDDHLLALYRQHGCWGAVAKSNFTGLRGRAPVYRSLRELVMSYFEQYFNLAGERTLRGYTLPLDLSRFDNRRWLTETPPLDDIADGLDRLRRFRLLPEALVADLPLMDERSLQIGLQDANPAGLYKPDPG